MQVFAISEPNTYVVLRLLISFCSCLMTSRSKKIALIYPNKSMLEHTCDRFLQPLHQPQAF